MQPITQSHPAVAPPSYSHFPATPPPVRIALTQLSGHACPYLPGRTARDRAFLIDELPPAMYHAFMDRGFRRSGKVVYQPVCPTCRQCTPIRTRVAEFSPSKSMRRCLRRNADLTVEVTPLEPTQEKFDLYCRYQSQRHGDTSSLDWPTFVDFLYDSPVDTVEFTYRDASGKLLAVGICDVCDESLSSVYFYYDPAELKRGLGTFGVLREIEYCSDRGIPHYYLGFWVADCDAMAYKEHFGPAQILGQDGLWRDHLPPVHSNRMTSRRSSKTDRST